MTTLLHPPMAPDLYAALPAALAILSDAYSDEHRVAAARLLQRDFVGRAMQTGRNHDHNQHPAFDTTPEVGPNAAAWWMARSPSLLAWAGTTPAPIPAAVPEIDASAVSDLAELAEAEMGATLFAASVQPFADYLAYRDAVLTGASPPHPFTLTTIARFNVRGSVRPLGSTFPTTGLRSDLFQFERRRHHVHDMQVRGPGIDLPTGTYTVELEGKFYSASTANPTNIIIELVADGVVVATHTVARPSGDAEEPVTLDTSDVVAVTSRLQVRNGSANLQRASAVLRVESEDS